MSNRWTGAQQRAIDLRDTNILVSAAAGSGKTAVLVERILNLLEYDHKDIDSMLIVTFTNAAAKEMKDRIQKKLQSRLSELMRPGEAFSENDREKAAFLKKQIKNISRASISTVHSFCIEILRQNFQIAGIDPAFKIASESLSLILKNRAAENTFEKMYENEDQGFLSLVDAFGGAKSDRGLLDQMMQVHRFIQAQPYPQEWLKSQVLSYQLAEPDESEEKKLRAFSESIWATEMKAQGRLQLERALGQCEKAIRLCSRYQNPIPYIENIEDDKVLICEILQSLESEDWVQYHDRITDFRQSRLKTVSKKSAEQCGYDQAVLDRIKDIRKNGIKEEVQSLSKVFSDAGMIQLIDDISYMHRHVTSLTELVLEFDEEFTALKKEHGVVDFSDLEHLALKVLEDDGVRQSLQNKYSYIFFDEYQDSNLVQETIINAVKRDNNLFFVGDVKQSIYRFRLSDPTLFNDRYRDYAGGRSTSSEKIDLSKNFRSREEILDFCNLIFSKIMSEELGEVDYSDESHQLVAGRDSKGYDDNIELAIIERNSSSSAGSDKGESEDDEDSPAEEDTAADRDELEAIYCAHKISSLVSSGKVRYKDIAILMRSPKNKAKLFEKVLNRFNIPCYVDFRSSSYDRVEIKCLLDYLRIIDNRNQDEALIGSMSSAFGGFESEELIKIRTSYPDESFYSAVQHYSREKHDYTAERLKEFFSQIDTLRIFEKMWRLPDFIWYVVETSDYAAYVSGMADGRQRMMNIRSFIEKAGEYEESESMGLFGFLRQVDRILREKGDSPEKSMLTDSEDAVTVMSVHKSKGLEFNTVFLCDLGKRINEADLKSDIILHNRLGIGMKYRNSEENIQSDSIPRNQIKMKKSLENISEEIRILYVALTRAVDRLYMTGVVADADKFITKTMKGDIDGNIRKHKNYLSWICSVLVRDASGTVLRSRNQDVLSEDEIFDSGFKYKISIYRAEEFEKTGLKKDRGLEELREKIYAPGDIDAAMLAEFERRSGFRYEHISDTLTPGKRSVTEITKSYIKEETPYAGEEIKINRMPVFMQDKRLFSRTEIGTIVHMIMEKISIRPHSTESVSQEIKKMVEREILTEEEAEAADVAAVSGFFESETGRRMIESGRVYREKQFLMRHEDIIAEGIIDCFFFEDDEIILIDYKTDEIPDPEKYRSQLELYRNALESIYGARVRETYIYWLSRGTSTKM